MDDVGLPRETPAGASPRRTSESERRDDQEEIDAFNDWYDRNGSPLDRYRAF